MSSSDGSTRATPQKRKSTGGKHGFALEMSINTVFDKLQKEALEEIQQLLQQEPLKIMPALQLLRGDGLVPKLKDLSDDRPFPMTYIKLYQCPKVTVMELLPELEPDIFRSPDFCKRLEMATKGTLHNAWYMGMAATASSKWPKFAHNRDVFKELCKNLYQAKGNRLQNVTFAFNAKGDPILEWNTSGIYTLIPASEPIKTHVQHIIHGKVALEECMTIQEGSFTIVSNWSESGAKIEVGRIVQPLSAFFPRDIVTDFATNKANEELTRPRRARDWQSTIASSYRGSPRLVGLSCQSEAWGRLL
jgi:hypothetical protein